MHPALPSSPKTVNDNLKYFNPQLANPKDYFNISYDIEKKKKR